MHKLNIKRRHGGRVAMVRCTCGIEFGIEASAGETAIDNGTIVVLHFNYEMQQKAREARNRQYPS